MRPKGTGGKAKELTKDEITRIDKVLTGTTHEHRNRALVYLGLGSGMRISEMVGLRIETVAPYGKVLDQVVLEKHSVKSGRSRTVTISDQARRMVQVYLEGRAPSPWLFPGRGGPLRPGAGAQLVLEIFRLAAITGASSHSLRRTHANSLRRAGVDLKIIQDQLGHSSLATTERYFEVDPLEKQRAIGKLRF